MSIPSSPERRQSEPDISDSPTPAPRADSAASNPAHPGPGGGGATQVTATAPDRAGERREVIDRQKAEFGGMKLGSDFFGWLTATGTTVLLTALVAGFGTAVGLGSGANPNQAADAAANTANGQTVGLVGGIVLLVIVFIAYFAGGYVAGRMARFSGVKQGIGVWLWAVIVAVIVAVAALILGAQFDLLAQLNGFPRIPINEGNLTIAGIITAAALAVVSLVGAILGGLTGMRYHRRIDRVGLATA